MRAARAIAALLLLVCLLLSGCDLRNRQSSEDFIPTGDEESFEQATYGIQEGEPLNPALIGTDRVKLVLSESGEFIFSNPAIDYSYELPFIDLGGSHAIGCNQEIEASFGAAIRDSLERMEQKEEPVVKTVRFTSYLYGDVLTLHIERVDVDGGRSEAIYSVDNTSGERVSTEAFCKAAGVRQEELTDKLKAAVEERLHVLFPDLDPEDPAFRTALIQTTAQMNDTAKLNFYLDSLGELICIARVFTPTGSEGMEELRIG